MHSGHAHGNVAWTPPRNPGLSAASLIDLAVELNHRLEAGQKLTAAELRTLGQVAASAQLRSVGFANRYSVSRARMLVWWLNRHPDYSVEFLRGGVCLDVGCGARNPLGSLVALLLLGARKCIGIDVEPVESVALAVRAMHTYVCALVADALHTGVSARDLAVMRERLSTFDLRKMEVGDVGGVDLTRLEYRQASVMQNGLADGSVRVLTSSSFLEHVEDVDAVLAEFHRVLEPGGISVHKIDGFDHRHWADPSVHPLEFLREEGSDMVRGTNRIRPLAFPSIFERHGFAVRHVWCDDASRIAVSDELRASFVEPYRSMPTPMLETGAAGICVTKR